MLQIGILTIDLHKPQGVKKRRGLYFKTRHKTIGILAFWPVQVLFFNSARDEKEAAV